MRLTVFLTLLLAIPPFSALAIEDLAPDLNYISYDENEFDLGSTKSDGTSTEPAAPHKSRSEFQREDAFFSAAAETFRLVLHPRNGPDFNLSYALKELRVVRHFVKVIPFTIHLQGRTLLAFTRKRVGTEARVVLYADGTTEKIENTEKLRTKLLQALETCGYQLKSKPISAADKERELYGALTDLDNDEYEVRERASDLLRRAGLMALPFLNLGARSTILERQTRCRELMNQFELLKKIELPDDLGTYLNELNTELGDDKIATDKLPTVPATLTSPAPIQINGDVVTVGSHTFSLGKLRESYPDIYAGLTGNK